MPNWVIICHGGPVHDFGQVQVPKGTELRFWVNEGQAANVAQAELIITELKRNPDPGSLQRLIDQVWGKSVDWKSVSGVGGQWVDPLILHGDPNITCVGVLDLETGAFTRWSTVQPTTTLKAVLTTYTGNVQIICCR